MNDLDRYLDRVGYSGPVEATLDVLRALHHAHILTVPYENLDVQLGAPLRIDRDAAWAKIVERRRGGWCYEMNGVFGLALELVGFDVTRVAGGVGRGGAPGAPGNHLVNVVRLEGRPWIADVGLADGPRDPFPVEAHAFTAAGFSFRVEALGEGGWRMHNHSWAAAPYFDFGLQPADEALLAQVCEKLQTDPESPKRLNAVVMRHTPDGLLQLRGRVLRELTPDGVKTETVLATADDFVAVLRARFDLDLPEAASLWPRILERHGAVFNASAAS